jgi:hypothetical protein
MPKWIHDRAEHIRSKNPSMPESESWAIATQQSHALGKSPKGYGTVQGRRTAKAKFKTPGDDVKTAGLGELLTTPIPGTPKLLPHVADSFAHAIGGLAKKSLPPVPHPPKSLGDIYAARRAAVKTSSAVMFGSFVEELEKIALSPQLEAKATISGLMRKAERTGTVDKLKNTQAWQQLQSHAATAGSSKEHNPIFAKLHNRLGTYIKEQQGATS